jgi:hypothetical protein
MDSDLVPASVCSSSRKRRKFRKNTLRGAQPAERQKLYLRTKNSILRALVAIILMLAVSACFDEGECLITNTNIVKVSLRSKQTGQLVSITFDSVSIAHTDSVYYINKQVQGLGLPVNPGVTEMAYVLAYGGKKDTLLLTYTNQSVVLGPACGAFPFQKNLAVKYSTFGQDSVAVTNETLLRDVAENIRIYF